MNPEDLELHDATIQGMDVNYSERIVVLRLEIYADSHAKDRVAAEIRFSGVERLSDVSDFGSLADNLFAGNVTYWSPAAGYGTTNIYLAGGFIAITAQSVTVVLAG